MKVYDTFDAIFFGNATVILHFSVFGLSQGSVATLIR